ncbi:uncharacterized protein BXIN_1963 [Babesia sp. Xinjiang]|uniref:uncharacterized protein n=1 Tax=Babesia sp. Xinjiang TaxID=462227 RepID=UPI000A21B14F|nr:uncharacterized protein BXIN_1963 [Babesia sp. Xinjiang]ORM40549.1 hypothetical protein BXIN_1963 [Babesia sp. Xinjiang]
MADFCRFFKVAGEFGNRATLEKLRALLSQERESFRVCLQTLSHLLGLKLNELISFDRSFVMKDDVVSIYLSGDLPESVTALLDELDTQPARKHAMALQVGKLLKARIRYGLNDVLQALDGAPAKDLYSRSIACLLRITMCALKVECDMRRADEPEVLEYMVDETGASLCEVLSRCCVVLCIFGAEESNLFEDVKEVQETLLGLVPGPLMLHIIGAFPVIAFDSECLFSLQNRRVFVESLATILPDILDHILIFNRIGAQHDSRTKEVRKNRVDASDATNTRDSQEASPTAAAALFGASFHGSIWNTKPDGYNTRRVRNSQDPDRSPTAIQVNTADWEFAFGNVPRVRTLSLLLEFILKYVKVGGDDTVEKHMIGWLDALVSKPCFVQTFAPIFSTGDTSNFENILELSRILRKDIFVSHLILGIGEHSDKALRMVTAAGIDILTSDRIYAPQVLAFMVEGVRKRPLEIIECWCTLLRPLVLPRGGDDAIRFADGVATTQLLQVADLLFDTVARYALMQNFGDECHPDEDNVNACTARQLMVLLMEILGHRKVAAKLTDAINSAHVAMNETVTLETVQVLEHAVFCMWLMKMPDAELREKDLFAFVRGINEKTLQHMIHIFDTSKAYDHTSKRLEALEKIKKGIRGSRLRNMVENREIWFDDAQINGANSEDWDLYYAEFADEIKRQLTDAVLHGMPTAGLFRGNTATQDSTSPTNSARPSKNSRKSRRPGRKPSHAGSRHTAHYSGTTVDDYVRRVKLLMRIHKLDGTKKVDEHVCATIAAAMAHYNMSVEDCTSIFELMLPWCPAQLLHKIHESGRQNMVIALMNSLSHDPDERCAGLLPEMMATAMDLCNTSGDVRPLIGLMKVITSTVTAHRPLAEMLEVDNGLTILQNFIVYVNCLKISTAHFLEVRGTMNLALVERYLKFGTVHAGVPIQQFVHTQLQQIMSARAATFSIALQSDPGRESQPYAARGDLSTLDTLIVSTFQLFFMTNSSSSRGLKEYCERNLSDVFHWDLLGREYAIAFRTVALLFRCFSQLSNTKLMFIFEHFVGLAARVNGDAHSTARRSILTDDCLIRPEAVEYFYQVHRQLAKRCTVAPVSTSKRARAA